MGKYYGMKNYVFLLTLLFHLLISCNADDDGIKISEEEEDFFSEEIFFSEYIEGSSFNKALEIVNLTNSEIELEASKYSLRKQLNGTGDWVNELMLIGTISSKAVFVVAHESADIPEIIENADQLKAGTPMDFNGNDPIALFKDGIMIDIIGDIDNDQNFAKDISLRRKKDITEPATTFDQEEWESFELNNVEDLGDY